MTEREQIAACGHNFIMVTQSTRDETPYWFCSRCGRIDRRDLDAIERGDFIKDKNDGS